MARPKGVPELSRKLQGGALRYLLMEEEKGRPVSTIWRELFEEDKIQAMKLLLTMVPKDINIEADVTHNALPELSETDKMRLAELRRDLDERPQQTH